MEPDLGRAAVWAEAVALGAAATVGETEITLIVAVNGDSAVVAPCGICRELLISLAADVRAPVPGEEGARLVPAAGLLPNRFERTTHKEHE